MLRKYHLLHCLGYGIAGAVLFSIPLIFFVRDSNFSSAWLLYLGNMLFLVAIAVFMLTYKREEKQVGETVSLVAAGHIATVIGVIVSCILAFIILSIFVPGLFSGSGETVLENAPSQDQARPMKGLVLMVFMNAIVGNVSGGSFSSIILGYFAKRGSKKG